MKLLLLFVFLDALQDGPVCDTYRLQQGRQVLKVEMPVRAPVSLARPWRVLRQDLLAGEGRVAATAAVGVPTYVAVRVPHVVPVFLVEGVVRDLVEGTAPEDQTLLEV